MGNPDLSRAVGNANSHNLVAILCPCHRIIGSDGSLRGFAGTPIQKKQLHLEYRHTTTQLDLLGF